MGVKCRKKMTIAILSLIFVFMIGSNTYAIMETKLLASDGAEYDVFGGSVSISGNVALIGAYADDNNGSTSGSAYIFRWNGSSWQEEQKLLPLDGAVNDRFGQSVSISGGVALVGAVFNDDNGSNSGSAYIFRWNGSSWQEEQKLLPLDGAANDRFGQSVSISGDVALVGASLADGNGVNSGSAYIFRWNGSSWQEEQKLTPSDNAAYDVFGQAVSISGDVALIGAYSNDDNGSNSGSAYVFRWNGGSWQEEQKLLPSDGAAYDLFGQAVSISGDSALIGAYDDDDNDLNSGSAYIFRWNGGSWQEEQKLLAFDGSGGDFFGKSVSICEDIALVGADQMKGVESRTGSAYAFDYFASEIQISIDIKPGSEENCLNTSSHGIIPVAILGSADVDVMDINVDTLLFNGSKVQVRGKKEKAMCHYEDVSGDYTRPDGAPDGNLDLVCQFENDSTRWEVEQTDATLTGEFYDGTPFEGRDNICIVH